MGFFFTQNSPSLKKYCEVEDKHGTPRRSRYLNHGE